MTWEPKLHTAFSEAEYQIPQTDAPQASDYLDDLKGGNYDSLSSSEKIELLEALFIIMKSYVNMGYGLDPVNKLIAEFETSTFIPADMISSEDATDDDE